MANESENFDALRKLLALKRHEVPPPGYFDRLPREIHVRLAAARQPQAPRVHHPAPESNWLAGLLRLVESRPSFVGAFGVGICGVILSGIVYSHQRQAPATNLLPELVQAVPLLQGDSGIQNWAAPASTLGGVNALASTNPLFTRPPASLLFDGSWLNAQPAAFPQPAR